MASTVTTTMPQASNIRSVSRQTRINPVRNSRNFRANLRQNSFLSNPPISNPETSEPHGMYPALQHFTDAITALPREFRRHSSMLKEVDAKAWSWQEQVQKLIDQGLQERQYRTLPSAVPSFVAPSVNAGEENAVGSTAASVNGVYLDNASQYSVQSADLAMPQRRQFYHSLRQNLYQLMSTLDEKNHVIHSANEELDRQIQRLDEIYPHIADEVSEESRLGSLRHWAYIDLNPSKRVTAGSSRRDAAASLAAIVDNEIANRSENRRSAMLAKKQRLNAPQTESDFDEKVARRTIPAPKGKKLVENVAEGPTSAVSGAKKKKVERGLGGITMEKQGSARGSTFAMSREPSQQDNSKKRKAPSSVQSAARKRLNVGAGDAAKATSSPLAGITGRDAVKRSPALSSVRPVGRGRQNSAQSDRNRPSSSTVRANGMIVGGSELSTVAAMTSKSAVEVKNTMKESVNSRGDRLFEEDDPPNGDGSVRGGILLERSASKPGGKKESKMSDRQLNSPRLLQTDMFNDNKGRSRGSKTSTPVVSTFSEAEPESAASDGPEANVFGAANKQKRSSRPRLKDYHGLHDSLSPKGLPNKRTHKKTSSFSSISAVTSNPKAFSRARDRTKAVSPSPPASSRSMSRQNTMQSNHPNSISNTPNPSLPPSRGGGDLEPVSDLEENELENDNDNDDDELRYCYCNGVSYGEMVACDNKRCPREWFHLECIGLKSLPKSAKWYCDECKENLKGGRFGTNGDPNGHGGHGVALEAK